MCRQTNIIYVYCGIKLWRWAGCLFNPIPERMGSIWPHIWKIVIINLLFASETPLFVTFPKRIFLIAFSKIKHSISFASYISMSSKLSKSKMCAYFTWFGEFSTSCCLCRVISSSRLISRCTHRPYLLYDGPSL